jgi:hypothetical protein
MAKINVSLDPSELTQLPAFLRNLYTGSGNSDPAALSSDSGGEQPGNSPPIDPSLGGADDPTGQPSQPQSDRIPALSPDAPPDSKLTALQKIIAGNHDASVAPPVPPDLTVGQNQPAPVGDLAASGGQNNAANTPEEASFMQRHPTLAKILSSGLEFAQDAGPGVGSRTFGEGFQTAAAQPYTRASRALELNKGQAQIDQMKSQVTLPNGVTMPLAMAKVLYPTMLKEMGQNDRAQKSLDSKESIAADKNALALRKQGLRINAQGQQENIPYDELTEAEQSKIDLQHASEDAASAKADMERSKNDPKSALYQAAIGRLKVAQQNAQTAAGKLGLDKNKFNADYFGVGPDGSALPGATTDANGKPIGPRMANANKTPAKRLDRGDLAANAIGNLNDIDQMVSDNPDLFGMISGRVTSVQQAMGSDNPAIRKIGVAIHNYALASNGAHGVRSQTAIQTTEDEILNHFKDGIDAVHGGISQAKKSLNDFVEDQKLGNRPQPSVNSGAPAKTATPPANSTAIQKRDKNLGVVYLPQ